MYCIIFVFCGDLMHVVIGCRYAVMALVGELDEDDLFYVKREVEERLGSLGR